MFTNSFLRSRAMCVVTMLIGACVSCAVVASTQADTCQPAWIPTFGGEPGANSAPRAMAVFDDGSGAGPALYAGGGFVAIGGVPAFGIAKWDGEQWTALGNGVSPHWVNALTVFDDGAGGGPALYAAGDFTIAGGVPANRVARWDGEHWSALGPPGADGMESPVYALAVFDDGTGPALYAGGDFLTAGGVTVNGIAKWDGMKWSSVGGGMDGTVVTLAVFDDGTGPALYAGGAFASAGGTSANRMAKWNGEQWSALDSGMDWWVWALCSFDDGTGPALYAGGVFTTAGGVAASRIAKWNGNEWSAVGGGMAGNDGALLTGNVAVRSLAVFDGTETAALYAGGTFASAGGVAANGIAKWDGRQWSALGPPGFEGMTNGHSNPHVTCMIDYDDGSGAGLALYVGGTFLTAGDVEAKRIARWDSSRWSALGLGTNGGVHALIAFDPVVSGTSAGSGIAAGPVLFAGGLFTTIGNTQANHIAGWNGSQWVNLGGGVGGLPCCSTTVKALAILDSPAKDRPPGDEPPEGGASLYVGGNFLKAGGLPAHYIALWDGDQWSALGPPESPGMNWSVDSLAVFDDGSDPALYAGGGFATAGGVSVNHIAKWDGTQWSALGPQGAHGLNGPADALVVFDDGSGPALYVAGSFTTAGGIPANNVARWDGTTWSSLGTGVSNRALALTVVADSLGASLYVGGQFTHAGGVLVNRVAKWDGKEWSALGPPDAPGTNGTVTALTAFDDGAGPALYAGGSFSSAGGGWAYRVAKWDGNQWSALDSGMIGWVRTFAQGFTREGPALYVGGDFYASPAGDSYIARWQGCPAPGNPADLNGDGVVDVLDLLILLDAWGACKECNNCPADLNGDYVVDVLDLLILLDNWG